MRRGSRSVVGQQTAVAVVYVTAIFLSTMDTTIVNVALPAIGRAFAVRPTSVDAVPISYLVSLAVFVPASGWLGDRVGGKPTLLTAVAVFTAASALCGMASSLGELVLFRVVQGAGGGMLAPVGQAMLLRAVPPERRVRLSAMLTVATGLAPTLGPVLGGLLVTDLSWRLVFYVNVPIGICATVFGGLFLRRDSRRGPAGFDAAGFLLAAAGLGLAMYGISLGPNHGWSSAAVLGTIGSGMVLLAVLVIVELRGSAPVMDVRLLADRLLRSGATVMAIESVAFLGTLYALSLYFQDGRGLSPLASGLSTFPEALGVVTGSQLGGRLLYRILGPRRHLLTGVAASGMCIALLGLLGTATSLWLVRVVVYLMGLSVGQVFVATQAVSFATISAAASGRASTLFNVGRRLGGAVGVAVATTAIVLVAARLHAPGTTGIDPVGFRAAFEVAAAINLLGLWPAWTVRDRDAAGTIPGPRRAAAETIPTSRRAPFPGRGGKKRDTDQRTEIGTKGRERWQRCRRRTCPDSLRITRRARRSCPWMRRAVGVRG